MAQQMIQEFKETLEVVKAVPEVQADVLMWRESGLCICHDKDGNVNVGTILEATRYTAEDQARLNRLNISLDFSNRLGEKPEMVSVIEAKQIAIKCVLEAIRLFRELD